MKKSERTSKRVGSLAGEALNDPKAGAREKSLAASALTQRPDLKTPMATAGGPRFIGAVGDPAVPGQVGVDDLRALRACWSEFHAAASNGERFSRVDAWLETLIGSQR